VPKNGLGGLVRAVPAAGVLRLLRQPMLTRTAALTDGGGGLAGVPTNAIERRGEQPPQVTGTAKGSDVHEKTFRTDRRFGSRQKAAAHEPL